MKQKLLSSMLFLCLLVAQAFAQDRVITGTVTDRGDGSPLPGVTVVVKGTKLGTQTGGNGRFSISVPSGQNTLTISYLGYVSQDVAVSGRSDVSVSLTVDPRSLTEVIVTGYGIQRKSEVTGSISSIKGTDFQDQPIQTPDKALQGRVAGVQVSSNSGQPGGGMSVNIRGVATINGSTQPLYVVDGVQVVSGGLSGQTSVNALSSINPNDIESIEILKDAASAAIYGSLAGNGVVLITTKRGKAGKSEVSASAQYGTSTAYNPYKLLDATDWFNIRKEAYLNYYARVGASAAQAISDVTAASFPTGTVPATIPSYDWYDAVSQTGKIQQYDLSVSGGENKTKFFVSGSFNDTDGSYIQSFFKRGTVRGNLDHQVSDKLSINSSLSLTGSSETGPTTNAGFFTNGLFTGSLFTPPVNAIYNADGTYNTSLVGINSANIVQNANLEQRKVGTFQTVSNLSATYKIIPDLAIRAFAGIDFSDIRDLNYRPATLPVAAASLGTGSEVFRRNVNYNLSGTATYAKRFNEVHNFSILGGAEYRSLGQNVLSASAQGFASPLLSLVSAGSTPTATTSTFTGFKTAGLLGNVHYDYKGKYLMTANVRYDGSSRFGANHKFGTFYGFTGGWMMTEEAFMEQMDFISQLKPRISYGVTGTQPLDNFGSLALYGVGGQYGNPGLTGGLRPTQLPNPDLTWEKSAQLSLGLDFGFLKNRITGSFDVYRRKNTDLILSITLPGDSGFTGINRNSGSAKSEGYDFELNTINLDMRGFRWETNFNVSYNRNKLLSLYDNVTQINTFTYTVGMPLSNIYTYKWAGVNPADGRPMYYDINGNITYSPKVTDQRIIGDQNPNFFGGLSNNVSYKGVSLDFLFQYQYGNEAFLQSQQYIETAGSVASNQAVSQLQRWTAPGQITSVPRAYSNLTEPGGYNIQNFSSRFVETASYIRLKQATLRYAFPTSITSKLKIPALSVYVQGLNLATFTNYRGDDPENTGNNLNFYPNPRSITGGLNIKL